MKILWIADYNINQNIGGAQRTNQLLIDKGKSLGYNITEFNYDSDIKLLVYDYVFDDEIDVDDLNDDDLEIVFLGKKLKIVDFSSNSLVLEESTEKTVYPGELIGGVELVNIDVDICKV